MKGFAILGCFALSFIIIIIPCLWGAAIGKDEDDFAERCGFFFTAIIYGIMVRFLITQFVLGG